MAGPFDMMLGTLVRTLGEDISYSTDGGATSTSIQGVFEDEAEVINPFDQLVTSVPMLFIASDALPAGFTPALDHQVTARGVVYVVEEKKPDSHGGWQLILKVKR